jgi:quinol monooxygenase YgiN
MGRLLICDDVADAVTLYAVSLRDDPTRIRLFETYASLDAHNAHIQSPHS